MNLNAQSRLFKNISFGGGMALVTPYSVQDNLGRIGSIYNLSIMGGIRIPSLNTKIECKISSSSMLPAGGGKVSDISFSPSVALKYDGYKKMSFQLDYGKLRGDRNGASLGIKIPLKEEEGSKNSLYLDLSVVTNDFETTIPEEGVVVVNSKFAATKLSFSRKLNKNITLSMGSGLSLVSRSDSKVELFPKASLALSYKNATAAVEYSNDVPILDFPPYVVSVFSVRF